MNKAIRACIRIFAIFAMLVFLMPTAVNAEGLTIGSDKTSYTAGETVTLTAAGVSDLTQVSWYLTDAAGIKINDGAIATGVTCVLSNVSAGTYYYKAVFDVTDSNILEVIVTAPAPTVTLVTVDPTTASVVKGKTKKFTAKVEGTNSPAQTVTWSIDSTHAGTSIAADGTLTVASDETAATITVKATSTVDTSKSGTATVTVTAPLPSNVVNVTINSDGTCSGGTEGYSACKVNSEGKTEITANAGYTLLISNPNSHGVVGALIISSNKNIVLVNGVYDGSGYKSGAYIAITSGGKITAGTYDGDVYSLGEISGGTFSRSVQNSGTISGGTFSGIVDNYDTISKGIFTGTVNNIGSKATFNAIYTSGDGAVSIAATNPSDKSELTPIVYEKGSTATATQVTADFNIPLEYVQKVSVTPYSNNSDGEIVAGTPIFLRIPANEVITSETKNVILYSEKNQAAAVISTGSTIITFYQSYLDTLEPGTYTVTINYGRNINGEFTFTVTAPEVDESPDTGDNAMSASGWGIIFLISIGAAVMCIRRKKQLN